MYTNVKDKMRHVCKTAGSYESIHRHGRMAAHTKDKIEVGTGMKSRDAKRGLKDQCCRGLRQWRPGVVQAEATVPEGLRGWSTVGSLLDGMQHCVPCLDNIHSLKHGYLIDQYVNKRANKRNN